MPPNKKFLLRLSPGLFDALRRWADDDLRSINGQVEYLLTDQARRAGRLSRQSTRRPSRGASGEDLADPEGNGTPAGAGGERGGAEIAA